MSQKRPVTTFIYIKYSHLNYNFYFTNIVHNKIKRKTIKPKSRPAYNKVSRSHATAIYFSIIYSRDSDKGNLIMHNL